VHKNAAIWREIIPHIVEQNNTAILLIATNPVDVLTYVAWKLSELPSRQVIGSGTILDTARFRYLLSQHFGVDARSVHAFIAGEHGDSEVPLWSLANIAGMRLKEFAAAHGQSYDPKVMEDIFHQTRDAAYRIIERKGATYYAVAAGLMRITQAVLRNQNTVLSVSSLIENYYGIDDVCLSLPTVVNRSGIEKVLRVELSQQEIASLQNSAHILRQTISKLGM
jgi:L-lactate dehydrogenase